MARSIRCVDIPLALALGWCVTGCGQAPPAAPAPPVKAAPAVVEKKADPPVQAAVETPPKPEVKPAAVVKARIDTPNDRMLFFTPAGPLVVQFQFDVDGRPLSEVRAELVARMLALSDSDGDGKTSWSEALASQYFAGDGRMNSGGERLGSLERTHDRNHDGFLDLAEAEKLASVNDVGAGVFRLDSEGRNLGADPTQSAGWILLDQDEDRTLSVEELAAAPGRLKSRDADDNDLLEPAELSPSPATLANPLDRPAATNVFLAAPKVVQLGSRARWDSLVVALVEAYQEDERLAIEKYPLAVSLLAAVDKNKNGKLEREEVRALSECAPHAVIRVKFGQPPGVELIKVEPAAAPAELVPGKDPLEKTIRFTKVDVELRVRDNASGLDLLALARTQFSGLDQDANGYLDGDEFAPAYASNQLGFAATDANGDGKIVVEELLDYVRRQQAFLMANPRARPAAADEAGWSVLDADSDGRLSLREIRTAGTRLAAFDRDADGRLTSGEMPRTLIVRIERGVDQPQRADPQTPEMARPSSPRTAAGPPWFDRMDSNADGDVSSREFLGTPEQFAALDLDQDGFVSRGEAEKSQAGE